MLLRKNSVIAIAILAIAVLGGYLILRDNDKEQMKKALYELRDISNQEQKCGAIAAASKAGKVAKHFAEDGRIEHGSGQLASLLSNSSGRKQVIKMSTQAFLQSDYVRIDLNKPKTIIDDNGSDATMYVSANVDVSARGFNYGGWGEYVIRWKKLNGDWLIKTIAKDSSVTPVN